MALKTKRNWSFAETKALIHAYGNRQEEYATTVKKRQYWEAILTDLEALDVLENFTTAEHIEVKWRSLWRSYKSSKDRGSGGSSSRFVFLELMDEIFSSRPIISSSHSRSVGVVSETIEPVYPSQLLSVQIDEETVTEETLTEETVTEPVQETPKANKRHRKSNSDKLTEIRIKYYEEKIRASKEKEKLLKEYITNKSKAREQLRNTE